jgi:hypothetical protein
VKKQGLLLQLSFKGAFERIVRATRTRAILAEPLGQNALAAKLAGMAEQDHVAVLRFGVRRRFIIAVPLTAAMSQRFLHPSRSWWTGGSQVFSQQRIEMGAAVRSYRRYCRVSFGLGSPP